MALQDLLILDHFLYSFDVPAFNRLRALINVLKNCEYKQVTRPDSSYEGVYLIAHDGSYLELLKHPMQTPSAFALALSSLSTSQETVNQLPKLHPKLQWFTHKVSDSNNTPWYSYYGQVPITETQRQELIIWAMLYHNLRRHRPYQYYKKPPSKREFSIQEFTAVRIKMPARYIDLARLSSQWVPGTHSFSDQKATLRILNPSFHEFEISLEIDKEKPESKLVSVTMELVEDAQLESQQIKGIRLTRLQNTLILNF
jgi:hypothetical protein